jgi:hypothetical protein
MSHEWIMSYDDRIVPCIKAGRCMYAIWTADLKFICVRWVDDYYGFSSDKNLFFNNFLAAMGKKFPLKLLGDMKQVLGTEIIWQGESAILRQTKNIIHLVKEYKVLELVKGDVRIPLSKADMDGLLMPEGCSGDVPYRNLLGELGWIAMCTRPDIIFHVRLMASYASKHDESHYGMLLQIAKYLQITMSYGVILSKPGGRGPPFSLPMQISSWCDASHGSCKHTKRSTTGTLTFLNGSLISYTSNKQKTVALSSTESELMGVTEAAREVQYFRHLLGEFAQVESPSRIHSDSEGAGFLASNDKNSTQTRHISIKHFYCRELVDSGDIEVGFVPGKDNMADMGTKPLDRVKLWEFAIKVLALPS